MIKILITKKHMINKSGKTIHARYIRSKKGRILEAEEL